jgi:23S rRNA (uracil1939-C5)-methyltransferase
MIAPGEVVTLDVEKPAAGGRMLARLQGQVVLVSGAIPGERVQARVERGGKGVLFATAVDIITPSPDRRDATADWRCGGNVLAHIAYARQVALKGQIVQDAFGRIGRLPLAAAPPIVASPEHGYRMRARLHVRDGRFGFYREGTHELCDAAATGQLLPDTHEWIRRAESLLNGERAVTGVEVTENVAGDQRAYHFELRDGADAARIDALTAPLGARRTVTERIAVGEGGAALQLTRDVRSFFQGNRYLLDTLVRHVLGLVAATPVVDLYAGVGLFGLARAASAPGQVTLVEGDPTSGADLQRNAAAYGERARVERRSVESWLQAARTSADATFIVDPPRTGMTKDAVAGIIRTHPKRIVYVSCDVATLARDTRTLLDAGYELEELTGFDLFPNTAHVENVAVFSA